MILKEKRITDFKNIQPLFFQRFFFFSNPISLLFTQYSNCTYIRPSDIVIHTDAIDIAFDVFSFVFHFGYFHISMPLIFSLILFNLLLTLSSIFFISDVVVLISGSLIYVFLLSSMSVLKITSLLVEFILMNCLIIMGRVSLLLCMLNKLRCQNFTLLDVDIFVFLEIF